MSAEKFAEKKTSYKWAWVRKYISKTPLKGYIEDSNLQLCIQEPPWREKNYNLAIFKKLLKHSKWKQEQLSKELNSLDLNDVEFQGELAHLEEDYQILMNVKHILNNEYDSITI